MGGGQGDAALTYENPFHPAQCDLAIAAAQRTLSTNDADERARTLLAEGLLCRGLANDDPWALDAAIAAFAARRAHHAQDFFVHLYLAEALRRRFPLSDEVPPAFARTRAVLAVADVGAAYDALAVHLDAAEVSINRQREQFLALLRRRQDQLAANTLTADQLPELLTLLAQTGPVGVSQALATLDARLASGYDPFLDTFHRAELLRGRHPAEAVAALYRAAERLLCHDEAVPQTDGCTRTRWRLQFLPSRIGTQGGMQ